LRLTITEMRICSSGGIAPTTRAAAGSLRTKKGSETRGEEEEEGCIVGSTSSLDYLFREMQFEYDRVDDDRVATVAKRKFLGERGGSFYLVVIAGARLERFSTY
jgi:hypothetical protein